MRRLDHENTDHSETLFLKRPTLRLAFLLIIAAAALAATAGAASAKTSCGQKVVDDWYGSKSGQLRHTYPLHCYRDALKIVQVESDLDIYSNARQDITLAMQLAIAGNSGGPQDPTASIFTADALPSFLGGPYAENGGQPPASVVPLTLGRRIGQTRAPTDVFQGSSASSVPLPAIVLGAIAVLMLLLGSAAYVARRRQLRRQTLRPQAESGPRNP